MRGKEMYYSTDFTKFLVDVVKTSDAEVTYIWESFYKRTQLEPEKGYEGPESESKEIRRIRKVTEYTDWRMKVEYPEADNSMRFKWSDRLTLNYI